MNISRHKLLAEITIVQKGGLPKNLSAARAVFSLGIQGKQLQDKDGNWWEVGTVMHTDSMETLGRRAVCAEEGHVLPEVVRDKVFGCKRCDLIFTGSV